MIFNEKNIVLKNGKQAILKTPCIEDAEMLLNSIKTSTGETEFLSRTMEDWESVTVESEEKFIHNVRESQNTLFIACYVDGVIAGNCDITFKTGSKTSHVATVGIALQKKYWNIGIGSAMFKELIKAAEQHNGTEIVDLEMIEGNNRAKALYEKFGFKSISVKPKYFKLKNGTYQNLVYMQKYL
ncbi:MAG: GNAT family N-acetyltransferase [Ruminococcaceae bacterium]|nr:GNAT family N-acetyltransferase [Oscillospiraceae bacterium]